MAQTVKNMPAMRTLGQEDPLDNVMPTHSSILVVNSMDRGAWWAIVRAVTKSRTQLSN